MSTDSGSTAADDRRRRMEDPAVSGDETAMGNEPGLTRRLDTSEAPGAGRHDTEVIGTRGAPESAESPARRRNDTEVIDTAGTRGNDTQVLGTARTRPNDTQVLGTAGTRGNDTEIIGTRDPDGAAYESATPQTRRRDGQRLAPEATQPESAGRMNRAGRGPRAQGLPNREALLAAERERFGGIKFGAAFFGWLTATGMVVLLSAAAAAIGAAVGVSTDTDLGAALDQASANQSAGLAGAIIALAVLLLAYYAGGYVAGRMARFNGLKQGLAVWLWALVAAAVVIIAGLVFGNDIRSITQLNSVAPLPQDLGSISAGAWLAVGASLLVSLVGALLGGLAGMRFHRRVDRAHYPPVEETA